MSYIDNYNRGKEGRSKSRDTSDGFGGMLSDFGYTAGRESAAREQRAKEEASATRRQWEAQSFHSYLEHERYLESAGYVKKRGKWYHGVTGEEFNKKPPPKPLSLTDKIVVGIIITVLVLVVVGMVAYAIISSMPPDR